MRRQSGSPIFGMPLVYRIKCFLIERVLWRWVMVGLLGCEAHPMPDLRELFEGKSVLVAACGPGNVTTGPPVEGAAEVSAFDLSGGFVRACKANRPEWKVFQGDALRLPCRDGTFDVVTLYSALHHIPAPAEEILREIARVSRGQVAIVEGLLPARGALRWMLAAWWRVVDHGFHYYTRVELEQALAAAGMVVESFSAHGPLRHMALIVLKPNPDRVVAAPVRARGGTQQ